MLIAVHVRAGTIECSSTSALSSHGAHCNYSLELHSDEPTVVCVYNSPCSLLGGCLLRLFDVQTVRVRSQQLGLFELYETSEDTWLTCLVGRVSAEEQAQRAFSPQ